MTSIEYTTPKGAKIKITAIQFSGFSAEVNGKLHTTTGAEFVATDAEAGAHVALAGKAKAQIPADLVAEVAEFFRVAAKQQAAERAAYRLTDSEFSATVSEKMYGRDAKLSAH